MILLDTHLTSCMTSVAPVAGSCRRVELPRDWPDDGLVVGAGHGVGVRPVQLPARDAPVDHVVHVTAAVVPGRGRRAHLAAGVVGVGLKNRI